MPVCTSGSCSRALSAERRGPGPPYGRVPGTRSCVTDTRPSHLSHRGAEADERGSPPVTGLEPKDATTVTRRAFTHGTLRPQSRVLPPIDSGLDRSPVRPAERVSRALPPKTEAPKSRTEGHKAGDVRKQSSSTHAPAREPSARPPPPTPAPPPRVWPCAPRPWARGAGPRPRLCPGAATCGGTYRSPRGPRPA